MEATEVPYIEPQAEERVPIPSHDPLPSGEDRLQLNELMDICTKLPDRILSLEQTKTNQVAKIDKLKKRVKNLEGKKKRTHGLKRLYKVGLSARVESSEDEKGLGAQEDASKQRRIAKIDANKDLFLIDESTQDQGRIKDQDLFKVHDLDGDEVFVDVTTGENVEHDATIAESIEEHDATIAESIEGIIAATTPQISKDDVTLAQTLMEIKAAKPKAKGVIIQEPSEFRTTSPSQPLQSSYAKDKGKRIMVEPVKPLKKKDQIVLNEEVARKLEAEMKAEMDEEERIAREYNEANIAIIEEWDDVQATIDADRQLAEQIQAQKGEHLSIEERSKLLAELIESRRKYFTTKRAEEIKNKPPIKAQQKSLMCTYMKNMEGFKQKDFKGKSFDDIKKMFDKLYKRVNTFVDMNTENVEEILKKTQAEVTEGSSKRAGQELEQESAKKQKLDEEDLEFLKSIVKERFKKTKPVDDMDNLLFQTLKTMFEHHVEDIIWKYQQGAVKVYNWKLYDSCGVYCVTTKNMVYYLLVEKMYPFTNSILHQLWTDVRL
nr:hypothetical protein [Tanacetum cinerariifolium]